ncbi:TonB-dependent siderophore receptor [Flavobacterium rhizosphaerae]|uniref:TonB-dependent receptor n=1 Tax=Flavobacterium rhizosphaerae TaxID=3163298 RepID=A0ABW8YUC8_9FLAO
MLRGIVLPLTFVPENCNTHNKMNANTLKKLFFCLTLCTSLTFWAQDRGRINGTIILNDNTPAENISVVLKGTNYTAVSNTQGFYEIRGVKAGSYTLLLTSVGITPVEESITISAGETFTKNVTLSISHEELNEVIINGNGNKFARTKSDIVAKMPLKDIENPQVYNTVTAELMNEQLVTNLDDALKNVPGLDRLWESTGRGSDGAGYFTLRAFDVQPTMVNGLPSLSNGSADPQNTERIDVIKGPSGTLFGSSLISYGGLINITTKKPYDTFGGNISYTGGTYGLNRYMVDINTPLGTEKKVAVRLNAAYHTENSYQDAGFRKSLFVAPSLTYKVNDRLNFFVNTEFYNNRGTNTGMLFFDRSTPLHVNNINDLKDFGYDRNRSYTSNDLYIDTPTFNLQAQMNYKINEHWKSQTVVSRTSAKSEGFYSYLYEGTSTAEALLPDNNLEGLLFARYMSKQNSETYGVDAQQNFIGDFNIGSLRNRMVVGVDYFNRNVVNNSSGYYGNGYVYIGNNFDKFAGVMNAFGVTATSDDTGVLSQAGMNAILSGDQATPSKTKEEIFSAYGSDVINFLPQLSAMISLRVDRFSNKGNLSTSSDDYNQTAYSPKFGLVYQPVLDVVSIFANYMDGFSNVAPGTDTSTTTDGTGAVIASTNTSRTFKPEHAKQFEGGVKVNLNNKLTATLSYYDITVDDMVYSITSVTNNPADPTITTLSTLNLQDGKQTSKGFEAFITANPVEGLNLIAGYSYNDSKLVAGDSDFKGNRPESAGPQNLANLWASYRFGNGLLNGFGLGFGGNYGSESKIYNRNVAGTFALPEYTVLNASVFYDVKDFTITLKLDNLTNEEYYKGWSTISPQKPRSFSANVTYKF